MNNIDSNIVKKYIPTTCNISDKKAYDFPKWYILRPIDSFAGSDIIYINNIEDLNKAIEYYNKTKNYKNIFYQDNVIASEYISNPLLFRAVRILNAGFMYKMIYKLINLY